MKIKKQWQKPVMKVIALSMESTAYAGDGTTNEDVLF